MGRQRKHKWPVYKTALWLSGMIGTPLTPKQYQIWHFIACRGSNGCDSWNYRIAQHCKCSEITVSRALAQLRKHALIISTGDLGKHRKLIACLYPNRQAWQTKAFGTLAKSTFPNKRLTAVGGSSKMTTIKSVQRKSLNCTRQKMLRDLFEAEARDKASLSPA